MSVYRTKKPFSFCFDRLESELDARTAALEASVSAAAGVTLTKSHSAPGGDTTGALDLAALLGVEETASAGKGAKKGAQSSGNNQINVQMINILQSQRDQYKDKLTKVCV